MAIEVFNRVEMKYLLTDDQVKIFLPLCQQYMNADAYNKDGKTYPISNLYFDTPSWELIQLSLEKPVYKEKLRLRSYGQAKLSDTVYLEIKKKFKGVVNKRRTSMTLSDAYNYIEKGIIPEKREDGSSKINYQVMDEIKDLCERYKLSPRVFISYDRLAFFAKQDSDFRLTLDRNIQFRETDLRLDLPVSGQQVLKEGQWLMEAKAYKAFPLWFARFLSENQIYQSSFSKYGKVFQDFIKE